MPVTVSVYQTHNVVGEGGTMYVALIFLATQLDKMQYIPTINTVYWAHEIPVKLILLTFIHFSDESYLEIYVMGL